MKVEATSPLSNCLTALPYHYEIVSYLKETEPDLWEWASSTAVLGEYAHELRTEMLKSTYRLDADAHPELAQRCAAVVERLGVTVPVTLYQGSGDCGMNAALCYVPGEAHIVFTGPILSMLKGLELDAVLAHELAHQRLWEIEGGDFLIADRLLVAAANDARGTNSHVQTARRFRLYTEVFADRGSLLGSTQLDATVATLIKVEMGVPEVSASNYLRQADEIFSQEKISTQGIDHPELFIRARALRLWYENDPEVDGWLTSVIEGPLTISRLDLLAQRRLARLTRRMLSQFLQPRWFQSELVHAHARAFFPDMEIADRPDEAVITELATQLSTSDATTREYFCYVLLDFTAVDPDLEQLPLAAALELSKRMELAEQFEKLAVKELAITKKEFNRIKKESQAMVARAASKA